MLCIIKLIGIAAIAVFCIIYYPYLTPQNISAFIKANGTAAPLTFITVCALRPVLFFLPSMGLTIAAGMLFGTLYGTIYVVIGGALSTIVGFYFARWIGRDMVKKLVCKSNLLGELERRSTEHGRKAVLYMRIFNMPWDLVSYWAGLSGIGVKEFYIASLIPLVPVSFLYTYFGSKVFNPGSAGFVVSLAIIFIMGAIPYWKVIKKIQPRINTNEHE
ncbi:MAG: TVP38/TMEM64 family protein [Nitrospirae bacterium]|nr:TVP38/TMEM64 family protein [Nitrospirota bacterium]